MGLQPSIKHAAQPASEHVLPHRFRFQQVLYDGRGRCEDKKTRWLDSVTHRCLHFGKLFRHLSLALQEKTLKLDATHIHGEDGLENHLQGQEIGEVANQEASQRHDPPVEAASATCSTTTGVTRYRTILERRTTPPLGPVQTRIRSRRRCVR